MKVSLFSVKPYDREFFDEANRKTAHELIYYEARLVRETVPLAKETPVICPFVNDQLDAGVLLALARQGTKLIALRSAGFNHVDLEAAADLGLKVVRVPAYSPEAVAEHTITLIMALNRKVHRSYARIREGNFSLQGLMGFNLCDSVVGIIGSGKIGLCLARILQGFGCKVLAYDPIPSEQIEALGGTNVSLAELTSQSDVLSLHCPLTPDTYHLINHETIAGMKRGVMLINTSRGALIDTRAVIDGLKSGKIGSIGLDVYEEEADLFFQDYSEQIIQDDVFARLLTFPNVIITGHQGFFTRPAMEQIAEVTLGNISEFEKDGNCSNEVGIDSVQKK